MNKNKNKELKEKYYEFLQLQFTQINKKVCEEWEEVSDLIKQL